MKNFLILALTIAVSGLLGLSCQKTASAPPPIDVVLTSEATVSDRSCSECNITFYVEVPDWDDVSSILVLYPNPANPSGSPLTAIFTSVTPQSYTRCVAPGTVYFYINGGPAAVFGRADDSTDTEERIVYLVNNSTGNVSCSVTLQYDCTGTAPWGGGGSCSGLSQG